MDCFKDEECGPLNMSNKLGCVGVGVGVGTGGVGGPQQQQQQQLRGNGTTNAGGVVVGGGGGGVFGAGGGSMCGATGGGGILVGDETVKPSGINERKRRASDEISLDSSTKASESGIVDDLQAVKDDDDDNDDDEDDKLPSGHDYDTERLKAFNMFVRLFVDENLDRMVPISKQPKDKIQAILEACDRQFPEFHERSRKRIRTYLKSCRRMRRSKEQNGWEPLRPTPPHLTSAAAEGILATACENESNNAKRMRMGLEPLPASAVQQMNNNTSGSGGGGGGGGGGSSVGVGGGNNSSSNNNSSNNSSSNNANNGGSVNLSSSGGGGGGGGGNVTPSCQTPTGQNQAHALTQSSQPQSQTASIDRSAPPTGNDFIRHQPPTFRPPPEFHPPFFTNSNGIFRPGFTTSYQHPAHHHPPVIQHTPLQHNSVQNGPTDLSMKKQNSKNQLSTSEVATIKQLIAGYRESAAFLYRSADELEQLLLQQN